MGGGPPDPPRFEREAGPRVAKAKVCAVTRAAQVTRAAKVTRAAQVTTSTLCPRATSDALGKCTSAWYFYFAPPQ